MDIKIEDKNIRCIKLEKYVTFEIDENLIKDKFNTSDIPNLYNVGIDFALEANIFYGIKENCNQYERIQNINDFDNYTVVLRLTNWCRNYNRNEYTFRVLKSNVNEQVDFIEEKRALNSYIGF